MNAEVHALAGPYALDALPVEERQLFEDHLAECAACRAEVADYTAVAARLGASVSESPPERLRHRVMAEVRSTRQVPPAVEEVPKESGETQGTADTDSGAERAEADVVVVRRWRRWKVLAAAAAVLAVIAGGATAVVEHQRAEDAERRTVALTDVLASPDARTARGEVSGGGRAVATWSARQDAAIVVLDELPPHSEDQTYQLWLMRADGTPVPSRTVDVEEPGRRDVLLRGDLRNTTALALTVEPAGGSSAPTTEPILALDLPR